MIGRIFIAMVALFIGACASSGPQTSAPAATAPSAQAEAATSDASSQATAEGIEDLDAPDVPKTAQAYTDSNGNEIVCRREQLTGSKMSRRVCRLRSDIEAREEEDQAALRQMRSIRSGSQADMEGT